MFGDCCVFGCCFSLVYQPGGSDVLKGFNVDVASHHSRRCFVYAQFLCLVFPVLCGPEVECHFVKWFVDGVDDFSLQLTGCSVICAVCDISFSGSMENLLCPEGRTWVKVFENRILGRVFGHEEDRMKRV
jgi:hypothetical protein